MALESTIQKSIIEYLRLLGYKVHRMNSGGKRVPGGYIHLCESGTPDVLILGKNNFILWIEFKQPGKEPTEIQEQRIAEYRAMGHTVLVAHSLHEVKSYFFHEEL